MNGFYIENKFNFQVKVNLMTLSGSNACAEFRE